MWHTPTWQNLFRKIFCCKSILDIKKKCNRFAHSRGKKCQMSYIKLISYNKYINKYKKTNLCFLHKIWTYCTNKIMWNVFCKYLQAIFCLQLKDSIISNNYSRGAFSSMYRTKIQINCSFPCLLRCSWHQQIRNDVSFKLSFFHQTLTTTGKQGNKQSKP